MLKSGAVASKFSMTPDDDCNNKFGQVRIRADATEDEIVQDSYRQVCLCDGYKAVASVRLVFKIVECMSKNSMRTVLPTHLPR